MAGVGVVAGDIGSARLQWRQVEAPGAIVDNDQKRLHIIFRYFVVRRSLAYFLYGGVFDGGRVL